MKNWPSPDRVTACRYVKTLPLRTENAKRVYRSILGGFEKFVATFFPGRHLTREVVEAWLFNRREVWPLRLVVDRARKVDRFLDWMSDTGIIPVNPLAELRRACGKHTGPIVRALLSPQGELALEKLRGLPRFGSFLGPRIQEHVNFMRKLGFRYDTHERNLFHLDRFLQEHPGLSKEPFAIIVREWANSATTVGAKVQRLQTGRALAREMGRGDPGVIPVPYDRTLARHARAQYRRPHIYSLEEVKQLLTLALHYPSPRVPLRPMALHTMLVLAYCLGLRIGEIVRLTLGDLDLNDEILDIRESKFFKSRRLPLSRSVAKELQVYLDARRQAGAPTERNSPLFCEGGRSRGYSRSRAWQLLVQLLRQAGLKPAPGRKGPRIHDLRHTFAVHRLTAWYREGIDVQSRLPYLSTFLGHKTIHSTLVYLSMTEELLRHAGNRFHDFGLGVLTGGASCK